MYPKIVCNLDKLACNIKNTVALCHKNNVSVMGVTKAVCAWGDVVDVFIESGIDYIADSRIENLVREFNVEKVLLRLPQKSQIDLVVKHVDISLNSSIETIKLLNNEAIKQNKLHKVILMFDIGDLREGIYYKDDYITVISEIMGLSNIILEGIGTNLTCYGGVIPTKQTLEKLELIGKNIENHFNIDLKIKSFGNSSSIYLFNNFVDFEYFNNLRLGESILLGRETAYGSSIDNMHQDVFLLQAQIIEIYCKPSLPEGEIGMNAFGEKVEFVDQGEMKRAIVAIGKQDVDASELVCLNKNVSIVGSSSDHMIVELKDCEYEVGDVIEFGLNYSSLLSLTTSKYVYRGVKNGK